MKLFDVNVLVYAHREDACADHRGYADWLTELASGKSYFGYSELVLTGFVRVVTNRRILREPTPVEEALEFCNRLRNRPNAVSYQPGPRCWEIFSGFCQRLPANGKLVADAWHAALAVEHDCEWYSTDADFSRFPGLNWKHPLTSV